MNGLNRLSGKLDPGLLSAAERYFRENFQERFETGQGTEDVLRLVGNYVRPGRWIDLGCGTSTLFWSLAMPPMVSIHAVDISREALFVLKRFARSEIKPPAYIEAAALLRVSIDLLAHQRKALTHFRQINVFSPWRIGARATQFDTISAFGVFSLGGSPEQFERAVVNAKANLAAGGILVGANWVLRDRYSAERGIRNDFVNAELISRAAKAAGLTLADHATIPMRSGRHYKRIEAYAMTARRPIGRSNVQKG